MAYKELIQDSNIDVSKLMCNEQGKCPYCGSKDLTYGGLEFMDGNIVCYPCICDDCGTEYNEYQVLTFYTNNKIRIDNQKVDKK